MVGEFAGQIKSYNDRVGQIRTTLTARNAALKSKEVIEKSNGNWEETLEDMHDTVETGWTINRSRIP